MAGSYPDVPNRRMGYDADGTVGLTAASSGAGAIVQISAAGLTKMNNEYEDYYDVTTGTSYIYVIFPELRDLDGSFYAFSDRFDVTGEPGALATSGDTTNGRDGTWTTRVADMPNHSVVQTYYRTDISTFTATSVRGVRVYLPSVFESPRCSAWHFYGNIHAGETPDRMLYIDASTGLEYTGPIDWGNIPRGAAYEEAWYIKNNSSTLTANNTTIDVESLYLGSDVFYTFSTGVGYSTSLGPVSTIGASSRWPPSNSLVVRCEPPSTAPLNLHAARIVMNTSSWS